MIRIVSRIDIDLMQSNVLVISRREIDYSPDVRKPASSDEVKGETKFIVVTRRSYQCYQ